MAPRCSGVIPRSGPGPALEPGADRERCEEDRDEAGGVPPRREQASIVARGEIRDLFGHRQPDILLQAGSAAEGCRIHLSLAFRAPPGD
jgi:hypothetical protein